MKQLKEIQANLHRFAEKGISVVAISPELEKEVIKTKNKHNLTFELVSDRNGTILNSMGLMFKVESGVLEVYNSLGISLPASQGNDKGELPIPATYLIGKNGKTIYAHIDADYRVRPKVLDVLTFSVE